MELFATLAVLWVLYKLTSNLSSKSNKQPRNKKPETNRSDNPLATRNTAPSRKYSNGSSRIKSQPSNEIRIAQTRKSYSAKRSKTYSGPLFAQPGEKSKLFGYADKTGIHELDSPFAIIDLETSGFNPPVNKIIEIAILKIDKHGTEIDRLETLIDPADGNVGRTDIHGIDLHMLKGAPSFSEVSGRILELIQDSIVVAHNARFEENFLAHELNEAGHKYDLIPALDTLWLARNTIDLPNYKLDTVMKGFNERIVDAHTALGDVVAVSKILPKMLSRIGNLYYPTPHPQLPINSVHFKSKTR